MSGKGGVSERSAVSLAEKLNLSTSETEHLVDLVTSEFSRNDREKAAAKTRVKSRMQVWEAIEDEDQMRVMCEWHHVAILSCLELKGAQSSPEYFSSKIGISVELATRALERLEKTGMIQKEGNHWVASTPLRSVSNKSAVLPSMLIQDYHRQMIDKAKESIKTQSLDRRDVSTVVFSVPRRRIEYAKKRIQDFRRELLAELSVGDDGDAVYCLAMQLFDLTEGPL
jgi:uncharacterized protein (TIGR02147 family)